jgi:hypothetical protein
MNGSEQVNTSLGDGTNFQTFFSFGEEWNEESNKENRTIRTNRGRLDGKGSNSKIKNGRPAPKVTAPANLFRPWFSKGLSDRVNKKLASELHKIIKADEKPKKIAKPENKVLKVYRSNRSQSRENSQRGSSIGSSVMSRSSERHSLGFPKPAGAVDQKVIQERCKKYYSDYLRVRINERPCAQNNVSSLEDSASQLYPSLFLSKMAQEGSNFLPHLASLNTHDSFDPKCPPQHGSSPKAAKLALSNVEGERDSSYREDNATTAYGFNRRNSSSRLEEKRNEKKLASQFFNFEKKRDPIPRITPRIDKKTESVVTLHNKSKLLNQPSPRPGSKSPSEINSRSILEKKMGIFSRQTDKARRLDQSQPVQKEKQSLFSSSNLLQHSKTSNKYESKPQNHKAIEILKRESTPPPPKPHPQPRYFPITDRLS